MARTVLIADNHPVFRNGVRQILDENGGFQVLAEVGDGDACVFQALALKPDAVILDLNMPKRSGFEAAEAIVADHPACRIVILSMYSSAEFVQKARQTGCSAFVAKEDAGDDLIRALTARTGGFFMSQSAGTGEDETIAAERGEAAELPPEVDTLTRSERRVLSEIAQGRSSTEIAAGFNVSVRTIHSHRQNICRKLGISGINSLIRFAAEHRDHL
ncbi:MAG: response regulator transcription factor [Nitratireductor sp.]|nr:response regulator transcription factor [Nitratireductor sp.]